MGPAGHPRPAPPADGHAYTDVYRPAAAGLDPGHRELLTGALRAALRLMALTDLDSRPAGGRLPAAIGAEPRPLLEIVARCLDADDPPPPHAAHRHDWPAAADPGSPYGRLAAWVSARLDGDPGTVDIPCELLSEAPPQPVDWPTDVLLRPLAIPDGPVAVLADLAPAGVLDARFAPALRLLDRDLPQVEDYRSFLDRASSQAGIPFVELLIPPLTVMAANAVRRPAYTTWWTGDPDATGYFPQGPRDRAAFLPLSEITLHAVDGRVVANGPHGPIWPVCHSVRVPQAPWDTIRDLLQRASPQDDRRHWRPLYYSLPGWPERRYMPRLTLGGVLVVSPAQWRIPRADLPTRAQSPAQQVRTVHGLRERLRLPRWITVAADPHDDPAVVDLESLHFARLLAELPGTRDTIWAAELLPDPGQAPVRDESVPGHHGGHLAELLFRMDTTTTAAAPAGRP
ncbi:lantibiotic dehydratase [Catellatospora bangladeshensis]|uniref:lantibiotic dehydratase n=1 Tax=Catellatospora bangladeshensis TaxID=310355 RepID=UPI0036223A98